MSTDLTVSAAVRDTILNISPSLVPITTLTAQATAGATSLTVASTTGFNQGGLVMFDDQLGERRWRMQSTSGGTTIALETQGMSPQTGLQYTHLNNTRVFTNIHIGVPPGVADSLIPGQCVICVSVLGNEKRVIGSPKVFEIIYSVEIQWWSRLSPADGTTIDPNIWGLEQQDLAHTQLGIITEALQANDKLRNANGPNVLEMGDGSGRVRISTNFRRLTGRLDSYLFNGTTVVLYRDTEQVPL